jgi:hypothetical protein
MKGGAMEDVAVRGKQVSKLDFVMKRFDWRREVMEVYGWAGATHCTS